MSQRGLHPVGADLGCQGQWGERRKRGRAWGVGGQSQAFGGGDYIVETSGREARGVASRKIGLCRKRQFQGCRAVPPVRLREDRRGPSYPRIRCFKGFGGEMELIAAKQVKS